MVRNSKPYIEIDTILAPPTKRLTTLGRKSIDGLFSTEYNDVFKYKYMKINEELSPISYTISEYNPDLQVTLTDIMSLINFQRIFITFMRLLKISY